MPSTVSPASTPSRAGIATSETGERHIPSSTRADGSVRKEIRVRPGYRPPEDVEVYKNRTAEAWKTRGKGGVPGAQFVDDKPVQSNANKSKKKGGSKTAETSKGSTKSTNYPEENTPTDLEKPNATTATDTKPVDPEVEKEKEARKLSKKLRQAKELQQKKENGDALLPEQFEKVIRINELIRQLDNLGFNTDGEKKP